MGPISTYVFTNQVAFARECPFIDNSAFREGLRPYETKANMITCVEGYRRTNLEGQRPSSLECRAKEKKQTSFRTNFHFYIHVSYIVSIGSKRNENRSSSQFFN